jgi:hypothetical protein
VCSHILFLEKEDDQSHQKSFGIFDTHSILLNLLLFASSSHNTCINPGVNQKKTGVTEKKGSREEKRRS